MSGEFSGVSGTSGDLEVSGDLVLSGTSGISGVSESGDTEVPDVILVPDTDKGQYPVKTCMRCSKLNS